MPYTAKMKLPELSKYATEDKKYIENKIQWQKIIFKYFKD